MSTLKITVCYKVATQLLCINILHSIYNSFHYEVQGDQWTCLIHTYILSIKNDAWHSEELNKQLNGLIKTMFNSIMERHTHTHTRYL